MVGVDNIFRVTGRETLWLGLITYFGLRVEKPYGWGLYHNIRVTG